MAVAPAPSPRIEHIEWGRITVTGVGPGKDFKLFPGGARAWDWNECGTRHVPGIQPAAVEELLAAGADTVVLTRGMWRALQTPRETLERLERAGVAVEVLETREAAERYNGLVDSGVAVGGLFHSTC